MKTIIILFPVEVNDRRDAENIEDKLFNDTHELSIELEKENNAAQWYYITDFMEMVNNEEFNQVEWWISYVNVLR
jgi:hypothetical protein